MLRRLQCSEVFLHDGASFKLIATRQLCRVMQFMQCRRQQFLKTYLQHQPVSLQLETSRSPGKRKPQGFSFLANSAGWSFPARRTGSVMFQPFTAKKGLISALLVVFVFTRKETWKDIWLFIGDLQRGLQIFNHVAGCAIMLGVRARSLQITTERFIYSHVTNSGVKGRPGSSFAKFCACSRASKVQQEYPQ